MSDEVSNFLRSVEQLNQRRDDDDGARSRELEEKLLQQRRERQARREGKTNTFWPRDKSCRDGAAGAAGALHKAAVVPDRHQTTGQPPSCYQSHCRWPEHRPTHQPGLATHDLLFLGRVILLFTRRILTLTICFLPALQNAPDPSPPRSRPPPTPLPPRPVARTIPPSRPQTRPLWLPPRPPTSLSPIHIGRRHLPPPIPWIFLPTAPSRRAKRQEAPTPLRHVALASRGHPPSRGSEDRSHRVPQARGPAHCPCLPPRTPPYDLPLPPQRPRLPNAPLRETKSHKHLLAKTHPGSVRPPTEA